MTTRRNFILGFGAAAIGFSTLNDRTVIHSRPGTAFGTIVNLEVTARTVTQAEAALDAGYAEIRAVHKAASLFDAQSEVSRLNATGQLVKPSPMLQDIVHASDQLHRLTKGAFDPSIQPLWQAWSNTNPTQQQIETVMKRVGWGKLSNQSDQLQLPGGSALTFNGIAQGYAADRVMAAVQRHGAIAARIDTGEAGRFNAESGLSIQHPRKAEVLGVLKLSNGFVAVSGDYASAFTKDFAHHHIFDPKLGFSPAELSSVAVIAPTGAYADGLATAFMVMGVAASLQCLKELKGCSALFVDKRGAVTLSPKMRDLFHST